MQAKRAHNDSLIAGLHLLSIYLASRGLGRILQTNYRRDERRERRSKPRKRETSARRVVSIQSGRFV